MFHNNLIIISITTIITSSNQYSITLLFCDSFPHWLHSFENEWFTLYHLDYIRLCFNLLSVLSSSITCPVSPKTNSLPPNHHYNQQFFLMYVLGSIKKRCQAGQHMNNSLQHRRPFASAFSPSNSMHLVHSTEDSIQMCEATHTRTQKHLLFPIQPL